MDIIIARQIFSTIKASKHRRFADSLIASAIRYAQIRADWYQLSAEERLELDKERSIAHNAFISACDILARNMHSQGEDGTWRREIGSDRKDIGDFACWLHLIIGIDAR